MKIQRFIFIVLCTLGLSTADAFQQGDWLVRLRGIAVLPNDSSGSVHPIPHSGVKVSDSGTAELDFTYMWTDNIGTELILATSKHNIHGSKSISDLKIGSTWVLPPTLTLQYHFCEDLCFQPYLGVGVNYSVFYNKHCSLDESHVHLKNSWGFAAQAGFDYLINECWFVNVDAKYITMDTKAHITGATKAHVKVRIDPWVIGGGVGMRF